MQSYKNSFTVDISEIEELKQVTFIHKKIITLIHQEMELIALDESKKSNQIGTNISISGEINPEISHSKKKPRFTNLNDISESEISESIPLKHNMIEHNQSMLIQKFNELDSILNVNNNSKRESITYLKKSSKLDNKIDNIVKRESPNNEIYSKKNSKILFATFSYS